LSKIVPTIKVTDFTKDKGSIPDLMDAFMMREIFNLKKPKKERTVMSSG